MAGPDPNISGTHTLGDVLERRVKPDGIQLAHHGLHSLKGLAEPMDVYSVEG